MSKQDEAFTEWMMRGKLPPATEDEARDTIAAYYSAFAAGRDAERERAAQICENLVTYTENHDREVCAWCEALETAAEEIRRIKESDEQTG